MEWSDVCDRGMIHVGNLYRFEKAITRAKNGGRLKIGFLGGSITQGALASTPQECYAYLVYRWWQERFPDAEFEYINVGIGATTSQFGVARVEDDLLCLEPDIIFLEFSVNDTDNDFFKETFEGLVRRILSTKSQPALFMFNNVQYNNGVNAQRVHNEIGMAYGLPIVSMKESIYAEVEAGRIMASEISPDNLHPNDKGHRMVADVICNLLEKIVQAVPGEDKAVEMCDGDGCGSIVLPSGRKHEFSLLPYGIPSRILTKNRFEYSRRYQNGGLQWHGNGFAADKRAQEYGVADVFKNGWSALEEGSFFETVVEASFLSVQFRRTVKHPAPVAKAVVDGDEEHAVILDANFDETWGDCCFLQDIAAGLPYGRHTLRITITDKPEHPGNDFYLISVICA